MLHINCSMLNILSSLFNVQCLCSMFNVQYSMLNVRCAMFNVQLKMFNVNYFLVEVLCEISLMSLLTVVQLVSYVPILRECTLKNDIHKILKP